jgi:2,4-diketo-3-deoxy-L-fuconate hydrolase
VPLPFPRPAKVVCVGLNYRDHALEGGLEIPTAPMLFAKFPTSLIGPGDPIRLSTLTEKTDFEAELAVVIGERAKGVPRERAFDVVAGYACFNDVSARDLQRADKQWTRGKSFDTFGPVGPAMVPGSAIGDVQNLSIACRIDGELVQQGNTADMIFGVDEIIEYITQAITLEPGDLIATGTPAGIGAWHDPPRWLRAGDTVTVEIDDVGTLRNPVVAADGEDA